MQFHCEIEKSQRFESLLRRSGFNQIYITPKAADGQPAQEWRIIWLAMSPKEIEPKPTSISGTAGLIKGRKSIGLRVEEKACHAAWPKLRPNQEPPDQRILAHVCPRVQIATTTAWKATASASADSATVRPLDLVDTVFHSDPWSKYNAMSPNQISKAKEYTKLH